MKLKQRWSCFWEELSHTKASLVLPNFMLFGESEWILGRVVQIFFKRFIFWLGAFLGRLLLFLLNLCLLVKLIDSSKGASGSCWFIVSEPSEELSRGSLEGFSCSFCSGTKSALTCEENI